MYKMRNYNLHTYITNQASRHQKLVDLTEQNILLFKEGKISINELYKTGSFEKSGCRLEFCGIMNLRGGEIESGKLVKINGNFDYIGNITYYGDSIERVYKVRFYLQHESVVVERTWTKIRWTSESIEKIFNTEFIKLCLDNLRGSKRRSFISTLKFLCDKRYHIEFDTLMNNI